MAHKLLTSPTRPQSEICQNSRRLYKNWLISGLAEFTQKLKNTSEMQRAITVFGRYRTQL